MKTWNLKKQNDWDGIQVVDPETDETHATIDGCTPEALALIAAAPELLAELQIITARIALANADGDTIGAAWLPDARAAIAKAEGGEA